MVVDHRATCTEKQLTGTQHAVGEQREVVMITPERLVMMDTPERLVMMGTPERLVTKGADLYRAGDARVTTTHRKGALTRRKHADDAE